MDDVIHAVVDWAKDCLSFLSGIERLIVCLSVLLGFGLAWLLFGTKKERKKRLKQALTFVLCVFLGITAITILHLIPPKPFPRNVAGILVLKIDGDTDGSLQSEIVNSIDSALAEDPNSKPIEIWRCNEVVQESQGISEAHSMAREIGRKRNAVLVIWGNRTGDSKFFPRITVVPWHGDYGDRTLHVQDIHELNLPAETVDKPIYLAHFVIGCALSLQEKYEWALSHFEVAKGLNEGTPNDTADLEILMGITHLALVQRGMAYYLPVAINELSSAGGYYKENGDPRDAARLAKYAMAEANLGFAYWRTGTEPNIEKAIIAFQESLLNCDETHFPSIWAYAQDSLGVAYCDLQAGDRTENINRALSSFRNALHVFLMSSYPEEWAETLNDMGFAYTLLPGTGRRSNLEHAVAASKLALTAVSETNFPVQWASVEHNLGVAYIATYENATGGKSQEYLSMAVDCFNSALRVQTPKEFPFDWADTEVALGNAYNQLGGNGNFEKAIVAEKAASEIFSKTDFPVKWAMAQGNLGIAYSNLHRAGENIGESFQLAVQAYSNAMQVFSEREYPYFWATAELSLGSLYAQSKIGNGADNRQLASEHCEAALRVFTQENYPRERATTEEILGFAYGPENQEKAIASYTAALQEFTEGKDPLEWAQIEFQLGLLYGTLKTGDRVQNVLTAKTDFSNALKIMTPENSPELYPRAVQFLQLIEDAMRKAGLPD